MDKRRDMRASDTDRQAAAARLSDALHEGRLSLYEYDERLARAYQSVTYGDLEKLFVDLPGAGAAKRGRESRSPAPPPEPASTGLPATPGPAAPGLVADLPTWVRVLWTIWFTVVSINLVVWLMVSLSDGVAKSFWPMWVAGPWGAVLVGLSMLGIVIRRARRAARLRRGLAR